MPESDGNGEVRARAFWSGTITFGLVSVPVNLLPANRSNRTSLRMLSPQGTPLSRRYFASRDDRPLDWDDIVRGYEIEKDKFVVVEDEELEKLAPDKTRDIDLRVFVPASEIDPMYFERGYFLTPAGGSTKAYRLLARAMEESDRAGIATFVMRGKEYLVAIFAENGILRAETLRFADELRTAESIGLPQPVKPKAADVKRMMKEIDKLAKPKLAPTELTEPFAERLHKIVQKKLKAGEDVVHYEPEADEESPEVLDLVAMLQRSLAGKAGATGGRGAGGAGRGDGSRAKAKSTGDLESRTKDELYDRAQELDIPGRSGMTKKELAEAIRKAG